MTNYKPLLTHSVEMGFNIPSTSNIIFCMNSNALAAHRTLTLPDGNFAQVPTGKRWRIVAFRCSANAHSSQFLITSTASNSSTGSVVQIGQVELTYMKDTLQGTGIFKMMQGSWLAEDLYLTLRSTDASSHNVQLYLEEQDA